MSPFGVWPNRRAVKRRSYPSGTRRNSSLTVPPWKNYAPSRHSYSARSLLFWCFFFAGVRLRAAAVTTFFHSVVTAGYALPVLPMPRRQAPCSGIGEALGRSPNLLAVVCLGRAPPSSRRGGAALPCPPIGLPCPLARSAWPRLMASLTTALCGSAFATP